MRRRDVLQVIAGAMTTVPCHVAAQTAGKTYRIGTLTVGPPIPPTEGTGKMLVMGWLSTASTSDRTWPTRGRRPDELRGQYH